MQPCLTGAASGACDNMLETDSASAASARALSRSLARTKPTYKAVRLREEAEVAADDLRLLDQRLVHLLRHAVVGAELVDELAVICARAREARAGAREKERDLTAERGARRATRPAGNEFGGAAGAQEMALPRSFSSCWSPRMRRAALTAGVNGPSLAGPMVAGAARAAAAERAASGVGVKAAAGAACCTATKTQCERCGAAHAGSRIG